MRSIPPRCRLRIEPSKSYPPGEGWHWYEWTVSLKDHTGEASGIASSFKRAQRFARKALRQLYKDMTP